MSWNIEDNLIYVSFVKKTIVLIIPFTKGFRAFVFYIIFKKISVTVHVVESQCALKSVTETIHNYKKMKGLQIFYLNNLS